ncbi:Uma2 family endonuclease [Leptolyngbya sp. 7M]|nr:Uma2 family endonuclease [Leptolyngbya sp. 7M]
MVVQGELQLQPGRRDTGTDPTLIAAVLSDSTQAYNRGKKFQAYRTILTFQEYLLIDQSMQHVEHYHRTAPRTWILTEHDNEAATFKLATLPLELPLLDLYDKVDFAAFQEE